MTPYDPSGKLTKRRRSAAEEIVLPWLEEIGTTDIEAEWIFSDVKFEGRLEGQPLRAWFFTSAATVSATEDELEDLFADYSSNEWMTFPEILHIELGAPETACDGFSVRDEGLAIWQLATGTKRRIAVNSSFSSKGYLGSSELRYFQRKIAPLSTSDDDEARALLSQNVEDTLSQFASKPRFAPLRRFWETTLARRIVSIVRRVGLFDGVDHWPGAKTAAFSNDLHLHAESKKRELTIDLDLFTHHSHDGSIERTGVLPKHWAHLRVTTTSQTVHNQIESLAPLRTSEHLAWWLEAEQLDGGDLEELLVEIDHRTKPRQRGPYR